MNIDIFNQYLLQISTVYEYYQSLKHKLIQNKKQQLLQSLSNLTQFNKQFNAELRTQIQSQSCILKTQLLDCLRKYRSEIQAKKVYSFGKQAIRIQQLSQVFPFQKISYSTLITTCLLGYKNLKESDESQNENQSSNKSNERHHLDYQQLRSLVFEIILCHLQLRYLRRQLIPMIQLYVPITQKNLTLEQLKDYLLLGNSKSIKKSDRSKQINPSFIILALNGLGSENSQRLQFEFYENSSNNKVNTNSQDKEKQNEQKQQKYQLNCSKIQQIMQRLNARVDNFGKQWLINQNSNKQGPSYNTSQVQYSKGKFTKQNI